VSPGPKMSREPPYRWTPSVMLTADEVKALLQALPEGSPLRAPLQDAAIVALKSWLTAPRLLTATVLS
jgi:hypothetical protein